jgi:hypothetical protein
MLERPELGPAVEKAVLLRAREVPGLDAACLGHGPLKRLGRGVLGAMLDPAMGNFFTGVNVLV